VIAAAAGGGDRLVLVGVRSLASLIEHEADADGVDAASRRCACVQCGLLRIYWGALRWCPAGAPAPVQMYERSSVIRQSLAEDDY
jgi:hypothetical protein